jgi:hypothetical protein
VEEIKGGNMGEALGPALAQRFGELVDMADNFLLWHRDLAVEHQGRQTGQPSERLAKERDAVVAVVANQLKRVAADDRQEPVPVMLDLVQPAGTVRRLGALGDTICSGTRRGGLAGIDPAGSAYVVMDQRGKYRHPKLLLQRHGHFDRQDWAIYAVLVATALVVMATYLPAC